MQSHNQELSDVNRIQEQLNEIAEALEPKKKSIIRSIIPPYLSQQLLDSELSVLDDLNKKLEDIIKEQESIKIDPTQNDRINQQIVLLKQLIEVKKEQIMRQIKSNSEMDKIRRQRGPRPSQDNLTAKERYEFQKQSNEKYKECKEQYKNNLDKKQQVSEYGFFKTKVAVAVTAAAIATLCAVTALSK